jgi:hypothetical protein
MEILVLARDRHNNVVELNQIMETPPPHTHLISRSPTTKLEISVSHWFIEFDMKCMRYLVQGKAPYGNWQTK